MDAPPIDRLFFVAPELPYGVGEIPRISGGIIMFPEYAKAIQYADMLQTRNQPKLHVWQLNVGLIGKVSRI